MNNNGYTALNQKAEVDTSIEKDYLQQGTGSSPARNGDELAGGSSVHSYIFSPQCIYIALIVLLIINALCLFATMRQLSLAAQVLKPFLDGRDPFFEARNLPRPDQYDGL